MRIAAVIAPHVALLIVIVTVIFAGSSSEPLTTFSALSLTLLELVLTWFILGWFQYTIYSDRRALVDLVNCLTMYSRGEFNFSVTQPKSKILQQLIHILNRLYRKTDYTQQGLRARVLRQEQILEGIAQGVVVCEVSDWKVLFFNAAAGRLLQTDAAHALGRTFRELCEFPSLVRALEEMLRQPNPTDKAIYLGNDAETVLQIRVKALHDEEEEGIESAKFLLELADVTELKRLEKVRRDFVANVSHELKTPITSIQGSVETLLDGALKDEHDAQRFVSMIGRHAQRLNLIFDDLLSLSRLEQGSEAGYLERQEQELLPIVEASAELCEQQASAKGVLIVVDCHPQLTACVNASLIQQALVNLVDNAVKYSSEGGEVRITASRDESGLHLKVLDKGPGIAANHLSRIFERFYRVDQARNRRVGGTGLGLSIVKHIAQAHGGRVAAISEVGKGSCFELILPNVTAHCNI
jgi:two-component system, OmpR family, phosphate regulon sensor histidine kinase PhoR